MKPKPFASLNHFTVPVAMSLSQEIFLQVMCFAASTWLSDKASLFQTVRERKLL
jgi:hypothetical protein